MEYDIWYSSSSDLALDFIHDFMKIDKRFGSSVLMTPRFVFWMCEECDDDFLAANCYGGGRYCAMDSGNSKLTGKEIVLEDLRQMCIYDYAYNKVNNRQLFWDYIKNVHSECDSKLNEDCSKYAHKETSIKWEITQKCVKESFTSPEWDKLSTNNTLIDKDIEYWR